MSIWASTFDLEDNPPYAYQGSHILPSIDDPRVEADLAVALAQVPSHITRDGRDDHPEDGAPWPWLRLSVGMEDQVLDRGQVAELHAALGAWLERTGPALSKWTAPPPGDTREQLPDHVLALIDVPSYTSTACEAGRECERVVDVHTESWADLRDAAGRLHARCRRNNKFTGVLCGCSCHGEGL